MGHRSCKGTKLTLWLWAGRTKEVRMSGDRENPSGYRLAAIEGRVYTRPVKRCVYLLSAILVLDTLKCS